MANPVSLWHLLYPNPEVPGQCLLLRLPCASVDSRPTPRIRDQSPWEAQESSSSPRTLQEWGNDNMLSAGRFEDLSLWASEGSQDPQPPPSTSLKTGLHSSERGSREAHIWPMYSLLLFLSVPFPLSSSRPRKEIGFAFCSSVFYLCEEQNFAVMGWKDIFLLWDSLGLAPDMLKGKKQRHLGNHLSGW